MKRFTIALDDRTAAWIRVCAADNDMSVSHVLGELLRERMQEEHDYDSAMRRYFGKAPVKLKRKGRHYPECDAVHDRSGLR